jgi:trimethylamine---corrinoid protein Co-methyltransferase
MNNNNNFSHLNYLTMGKEELEKIHELSLRILQEIGGVVKHDEALNLLREAGAKIDGQKVFISEALVNKALESVPREYTVYDRKGNPAMVLKERCVYYGPGSDTTTYVDYETGERRKWTKKDIENGMILCDGLEHVDFVMSLGIISDVDIKMNTREQYATMIRNTVKPQVVVCDDAEDLKDVIAIAAAVRGGLGNLREKPLFSVYCEPSSPLVNSFTAIDKLLTCAENSIPTNYAAGGMAGGTTPITAEGTILLNNAECLLGLVIHQLKNPGAPFLYGFGNAPLDMKTMQSVYAAPVAIQIQGGMCDLSRYYKLPSWGEAGCSSSKICDEQSALEAAQFILMAALQGCNVTHDLGYLNFGLSVSFEHLSVCNEIIGRTKATLKKLCFDDYLEAYESIKRVGHGGNYIGDEHTFTNMRASWFGDLSDYRHYDNWKSDGELNMGSRAHLEVREIIQSHKPEPLDADTDKQIDSILKEAKSKM